MAIKINGKAVKAKVRATRNALFGDEKYTGSEPVWDTDRARNMTAEEFDHHLRRSFYYYNYYFSQADLKKHVVEWMKQVKDFTPEEIRVFERTKDRSIPMTTCALIMAHRQGMPLLESHIEYIDTTILTAIAESSA
jgi:hypothetical protein